MNGVMGWLIGLFAMCVLGYFWMIYLIKIVLNDEKVQDKIRQIQREREEQQRAEEDRIRKRREEAAQLDKTVNEAGQPDKT